MKVETKAGHGAGNGSYDATFSGLADHTIYSNPCGFGMKGNDYGGRIDMKTINERITAQFKALTTQTGGAGTAGYAMVPVYVDPRVVDETRKFTPLVEIIPRVTNMGTTADYNNVTAKGGAFTRAEDSSLTETDTTTARNSTPIKYLYAVGRVTGQARAAIPPYTLSGFQPAGGAVGSFTDAGAANAKQFEVLVKARELRELQEDLIMNGNATTSGISGNPDGTEYSGIITLMSTTNTVDKNTSAIDYDDIELAAQYAFDDGGRPTVGVGSSGVIADIRKIMIDVFRWSPSDRINDTLGFGIPTAITIFTMVGPITIIPSMFMSNVSGSKAIYFLDMSVIEMRVLQDLTYEDLAKTGDADKFMIKCYEALIIRNTAFCSSITEISA